MISLGRFVVEGPNGLRFYLPLLFSFWSDQDQNFFYSFYQFLLIYHPLQK